MDEIARAFPRRPVRIVRHGARYSWFMWLVPAALALFLTLFHTIYFFPGPPLDEPGGLEANPHFRQSNCRLIGVIVWCAHGVTDGRNRIGPAWLSAILGALLLLLAAYLLFAALRNALRWAAVQRRPRQLKPMAAENVQTGEPPSYFAYWARIDGRRRYFVCRFAEDEQPLRTSAGDYLVAIPEGTRLAVMLDAELKWLELSDGERRAIKVAVEGSAAAIA
jgi:hypothetical protein